MHNLEFVLKNETHKFLRNLDLQMDHLISTRQPDSIIDKRKKKELVKLWTLLSWLTTK